MLCGYTDNFKILASNIESCYIRVCFTSLKSINFKLCTTCDIPCVLHPRYCLTITLHLTLEAKKTKLSTLLKRMRVIQLYYCESVKCFIFSNQFCTMKMYYLGGFCCRMLGIIKGKTAHLFHSNSYGDVMYLEICKLLLKKTGV